MTTSRAIAIAISLAACMTDIKSRRIPNWLTFGSAAAAVLFHAVTGGSGGLLAAGGGWVLGLALFLLPFALGGLGGGDVKLVAALGAWLGPGMTIWLVLYTGIAGGVAALVVATARGYLATALRNIWLLLAHWRVSGVRPLAEVSLAGSSGPRLAYAVPIFIGTVVTVWFRS